MEKNLIKPIEEQKIDNQKELSNKEQKSDDIINKLPDWNIEPPIEIKRGEQ